MLQIENLTVRYGPIEALHGVSLEIRDGEIVTLIGANGAGKTTLLRAVSGLIQISGGNIRFYNRHTLNGLKPHEIVRLGVSQAPEGRQIFANLTVAENLHLGAYQSKHARAVRDDSDKYYALFPVLAERKSQRAGTLSGGEQQMLAIARALMSRPRLLLLDEPSLGLAPLIVRKIFQVIKEINQSGTTVFLVEQNAHMALTTAHRGFVLQAGEIIKSASASALLADQDVQRAYLGG